MNDINFDITKHWLPVGEKQGSIDKRVCQKSNNAG